MKTSVLLAASALAISCFTAACGQAEEKPSANEAPVVSETTTATTPEPEVVAVADEKPEPDAKPADDSVVKAKLVDGFEEIVWEDMLPEGEEERLMQMVADMQASAMSYGSLAEGSSADKAVQIGTFNVVKELDGVRIRLPGYTVPFEYTPDAKVNEFLLVPYFGACLHAPPPPPNQTLYVQSEKPIRIGDLAQAVWVYGTLHTQTQKSDLADTAYTLTLDKVEEYEY